MTGFWWLLLGLLGGWLIELAIDYTWWRKRHRAAADEAARRLGEIDQVRKDLDSRDARLALRERDAGERETVQSGRDADLLLQAKRIDERGEAILRTEQRLDARRAELEKQAAALAERDRLSAERLHAARELEGRASDAQARVDAGEAEAAKREAMLASRESGIKRWEQRILAKEKELHGLEAEAARAARDAERWRRQYHGMRALIDQQYRGDDGEDDLKVIQGIGPKAERMLRALGVTSFARLAETPLGELSRLVEQGGAELALSDPMSWAEQAALLVDRDFIGFESLKARLRGDVTDVESIPAADMTLESAPAPVEETEASPADAIVDDGAPPAADAEAGAIVAEVKVEAETGIDDRDEAARLIDDAALADVAAAGEPLSSDPAEVDGRPPETVPELAAESASRRHVPEQLRLDTTVGHGGRADPAAPSQADLPDDEGGAGQEQAPASAAETGNAADVARAARERAARVRAAQVLRQQVQPRPQPRLQKAQ